MIGRIIRSLSFAMSNYAMIVRYDPLLLITLLSPLSRNPSGSKGK